jgi:hypothetical protein
MLDPSTDLTYVIGLTGYTFGVVVRSDASATRKRLNGICATV